MAWLVARPRGAVSPRRLCANEKYLVAQCFKHPCTISVCVHTSLAHYSTLAFFGGKTFTIYNGLPPKASALVVYSSALFVVTVDVIGHV